MPVYLVNACFYDRNIVRFGNHLHRPTKSTCVVTLYYFSFESVRPGIRLSVDLALYTVLSNLFFIPRLTEVALVPY